MFSSMRFALVSLLLASAAAQQSSTQVEGNNDQTAGTNKGVMIQNNITVSKTVEKSLKSSSKMDVGDEQGWLRLLTPAQDQTPPNVCGSSPNSLMVMLGGGSAGSCDSDSCKILKDGNPTADTKDILSVERRGRSLTINAVVFDEDGKVVAALSKNKPHINKNNVFDWRRPDAHTLDVVDQKNRLVLHVRFMNEKTVYVQGLFFDSQGTKLKIGKDNLVLIPASHKSTTNIDHMCSHDSSGYAFVF
jgi:WD40 repeat protein